MGVGAPLLQALSSAVVLHAPAKESDDRSARVQISLPPPVADSATNASVAAAGSTQLRVTWHAPVASRYIPARSGGQLHWLQLGSSQAPQLLSFITSRGRIMARMWLDCDVKPLANWLRTNGILSGSPRQQWHLLMAFVSAVFRMASGKEHCDAALTSG